MAQQVVIKRSPIVLIKTFALIELAAFVAYYLLATLGNFKYQLYTQLFLLPSLLSYQTLKILVLSGAQFFITIYAFVRWYYESYVIRPGHISHRSGVFFKKERTVPLDKSAALTVSSGPLGKLLHYGSVRVENSNYNSLVLADISRPEKQLRILQNFADPQSRHFGEEPEVFDLISESEHERLEFKATLRFDERNGGINKDLEKATMKTIAAFMNSNGGHLIIGVGDLPRLSSGEANGREVIGLENDYQTLNRKDSDGFENHFTQIFNRMIGPEFRGLIRLRFQSVDDRDVCVIQVLASSRPIYLRSEGEEHFYVRTGNVTTPLKLSEVESYSVSRFPRRSAGLRV